MEKLITEDIWKEVNNLISQHSSKKTACISYVSTSNLNLVKGDVLICDASENSINQGHTSIKALKTYIELGVEIFSLGELHSKLLISDKYIVIGSANLSENSAENLIESAIITDNKALINESTIFVNMLLRVSEKITLERIAKLSEIRPLNNITVYNLPHSNRKKIFQSENEAKKENESKYSLEVHFAEIREGERGFYLYLELYESGMFAEKKEKKHIYDLHEIQLWQKALCDNKYLNVYGKYEWVNNLPKFYAKNAKNPNESTELRVFVLCDKDGNLLEDPTDVAMGSLNSGYYKFIK